MSAKKVLVTGATGLLGAHIVAELNRRGYNVKVFARKTSKFDAIKDLDYELFIGSLTNYNDLLKAVQDVDYVIHSAARTAAKAASYQDFYNTNVKATELLAKAAQQTGIQRFIFVSTANCFTNGTKQNPGTEQGGFMPWLKKSFYAYTKYLAQEHIIKLAKEQNFPAIVVAPTFMIGTRDTKPSSGKLLLYLLKNKIAFYPPGGKSFVDVEYVAEATVNALNMGKIGEKYLLAGQNLTYAEFYKIATKVAGIKRIMIKVPNSILLPVSLTMTAFEKLTGIPVNFNRTNHRLLTLDNYFSNEKARKELNMKQTDIEKTLQKTIPWFVDYFKIKL